MEEFCPLCMRQGLKKKMKAIQINLVEAVWMCESEECIWPMDYKELEYIPRKIGESWSCYWNNYKPNRPTVTESHSEWQSFFTPPYTPKTEVSPTASSNISTHSSNGVNHLHNPSSKESVSFHSSEETALASNSTNEQNIHVPENNRTVLKNSIEIPSSTHNDEETLMYITNSSKSGSLESDRLDTTPVDTGTNLDSFNFNPIFKTLKTGVPTIVNIERANLINVKGINANQKSISESSSKEICYSKIETENLQSNNSIKIENAVTDLDPVEVRTVTIEGLPSVTLTYKIPSFLQETNNVIIKECKEEMKLETELEVSKKTGVEKCVPPLSNKCIMTSKMYEKFSFSELRKAKKLQNSEINQSVIGVKRTNVISETKLLSKPVLEVTESNSVDRKLTPNNTKSKIGVFQHNVNSELINAANINKNLFPESEDPKYNGISDLDSFLNDFIEEHNVNMNESMSPNIIVDDDWLSSLFA